MQCPSCSAENAETDRFCSACGSALRSSYIGTVSSGEKGQPLSPSADVPRFETGTILADRYRIVGLLGKGGMGEVYRADDLKLEQTVALKFLPQRLANRPDALSRFHREVRIARQITHPNICRVFDIGEVDGMHFLSMEYIDGEDLASLLRRIGRLPSDKAVEIARELCAGLNAAHLIGVLHRDLKPANIMLDGRGKAHITDFGLAGLAEEFTNGEKLVGTPAYMAPEQLRGEEITIQSDLYSLGLVLYEIFTGRRLFNALTLHDLIRQHEEKKPTIPDSVSAEMDPTVERVILRCLESDPGSRPHSVAQVFAALPGGDPLAAALAAGETPSPELIAASGKEGALRPSQALACLAAIIVGLITLMFTAGDLKIYNYVKIDKRPAVLIDRAQTMIHDIGYEITPMDTASGFDLSKDYMEYLKEKKQIEPNWLSVIATGQPLTYYFWYRQSTQLFIPTDSTRVTYEDPPANMPQMFNLILDPAGRLVEFRGVPPREMKEAKALSASDWEILFKAAGMNMQKFTQTNPKWTPLEISDLQSAWAGAYPDHPDMPVRVEAGAFGGRPTYFRVLAPWNRIPIKTEDATEANSFLNFLVLLLILGGSFMAYRNFKTGRGDRKGAFRLGLFSFSVVLTSKLILAHHTSNLAGNVDIFFLAAQMALLDSALIWLFYIALEPYVRRLWPRLMISWSRLLAGNYHDPMVGRDVLIGCVFGTVGVAIPFLLEWAHLIFGFGGKSVYTGSALVTLGSVFSVLGDLLQGVAGGMESSLLFLLLLLISYALFRRRWIAIGITWILISIGNSLFFGVNIFQWTVSMIAATFLVFAISRFGILTLAVYTSCYLAISTSPITSDFSRWYAVNGLITLAAVLILALLSLRISLAGQPLLQRNLLPD